MTYSRRLEVLRAIIEEYVSTGDPVGSKFLSETRGLNVSSATVRKDMAYLEEEGLIVAPYTSAGRVPTEKGYRLFVDKISEIKPLSAAERKAIVFLIEGSQDLDDILERTVRTLANITSKVAILQYPVNRNSKICHIELVLLDSAKVVVILITDIGVVEQHIIDFRHYICGDFLVRVRNVVNSFLCGKFVKDIFLEERKIMDSFSGQEKLDINKILDTLNSFSSFEKEERLLLAGTANLVRSKVDFSQTIGPILEALEEQVVILNLLNDMKEYDSKGFAVSIGSEHDYVEFTETSVVASGYSTDSGGEHKVGVLGPTRMDYSNSISAVSAVAKYLSRIL